MESLETRQLLSADPLMELRQLSDEFDDQNSIADWSRLHRTEGWNADQLRVWDVNQTQSGRMAMRTGNGGVVPGLARSDGF